MTSSSLDQLSGVLGDFGIWAPVRAASTASLTLSGLSTVDGVVLASGDRVLVKDQSNTVTNGIYQATTGTWSYALDFNSAQNVIRGKLVTVTDGSTLAGGQYRVVITNPYVPGTNTVTWTLTTGGATGTASGDLTGSYPSPTIATAAVTNAKMANMANATFKGRTTAGTGVPEDMTAAQSTALLSAMVGDSGSGVTKGLVPADSTGSASTKFLRKDGTWAVPAGGGGSGGVVWIATFTANNSSSNLDCTGFVSATYDVYKFVFQGLVLATATADLQMRIGTGGGPTYDTGNNYTWIKYGYDAGGSSVGVAGAVVGFNQIASNIGVTAGFSLSGELNWYNFNSTTLRKTYTGNIEYVSNSPAQIAISVGGDWVTAATAVTALRIFASSGNIVSGSVYVYGMQKS